LRLIIKRLLYNRLLLKYILFLHTFSYKYAGAIATHLNNGIHPKHRLTQYQGWFLNNIEKDWVVLDVGCNTGTMTSALGEKAKHIYGIEINGKLLEKASREKKRRNVDFYLGDATTFDYSPLMPIDCVTLSNVLEHIEERVEFLKKMVRQVNWRGKKRFLVRVPMVDRDWITLFKREVGVEWRLDPTHFTEYTQAQFERELGEAGIRVRSLSIRFGEIYAVAETG